MLSIFIPLLALLPLIVSSPTPIQLSKRYSGVKIQSFRNGLCLSPVGRSVGNNVQVATIGCYQARTWNINPGSGAISVSGNEGFVVDAGTGNQNGEVLKLWQSYPGLFQQTWYLTDDRRIAITGGNQCLDQGNNDSGTQTWECSPGNLNQIWTIVQADEPYYPISGQSAVLNPPVGLTYLDPQDAGQRIHPSGRPDLAITVSAGAAAFGGYVDVAYDFANSDSNVQLQRWNFFTAPTDNTIITLSQADNNYCLSVGANPTDGTRPILQDCDTTENTRWEWDGQHFKARGTNLCLDVRAESTPIHYSHFPPYDIQRTLQVWTCSQGNRNQEFFTIGLP
ncbi:uncharacterized protein IL334_001430 [Kwoniella shivajii]|uniref:Ricin B lectin domain-containing protein n=1 Tax=Kwoniella shivajii TaxID=564305 RepID=A0ABZ1CSI9_9TREE|nr:hypothetical protein IL334_001430 [Kwoniella shivajii]